MNIYLKKLERKHAKISWKWRNDKSIWIHTKYRPSKIITERDEIDWIDLVLKRKEEKRFAIFANDKYIGNCYLTNINDIQAELHIFIGDKNYLGLGVGNIAVKLLLNKAFNDINLKRVYLYVKKENIAAIKTYRKNGFLEVELKNGIILMEIKSESFYMQYVI